MGEHLMARLNFTKTAFVKAAIGDIAWHHDGAFEPGAEHFLKAYYDDAEQNDALVLGKVELLSLARNFWMLGQVRKIGKSTISVRPVENIDSLAARYDVVEIITDDRRFLVDSVIGAISAHSIDVVALFHPVVSGFRDQDGSWNTHGEPASESMIQVLIKRQTVTGRKTLAKEVKATLKDLNAVINDFKPMLAELESNISRLLENHSDVAKDVLEEACEFLEWIRDGNFVLLGVRNYIFEKGKSKAQGGKGNSYDFASPKMDKDTCYGVLRDMSRMVLRQSSEPANISSNLEAFLQDKDPVTVAKSNLVSRIHRRVRMDYISVKHYNAKGAVMGETRFVGLFTVDAYARSPKYVPLIRRKINQVIHRYGAEPGSHNAKRLDFVLESYPRDELFQSSEDDLYRIASGVAQAYDRPRTRLFVRFDTFKRYASVLVYVPRENYNTVTRQNIGDCLRKAFNGRVSAFYPQYSDSPLARVHFIVGINPDDYLDPDVDILEAEIASIAQPWGASLKAAAESSGDSELADTISDYRRGFTEAYRARFNGAEALDDVIAIEPLCEKKPTDVRVYRQIGDGETVFRAKFYSWKHRLELSNVMPIFSNMDIHVAQETGYKVSPISSEQVWVHDYEMKLGFVPQDRDALSKIFQEAFLSVWHGRNEDDGFNALILPQAVTWRRIALLRLLARYRKQSGLDPSESVQIEALATYPEITQQLLEIFEVKFNPDLKMSMDTRRDKVSVFETKIFADLEKVKSLDHDRALRRMARTLVAALRTNFFVCDENGDLQSFISLKINSQMIESLPAPKPYREIFVWSPRVEGVHLRFGPVARGGLRWSDRRDDFRTEVLGLVKAQQVKNAVIVPVGSKGCFYPKQLPTTGGRDAFITEGIAAYTQFISGMLDITDTYEGKGTIPPKEVVCWDGPDPYLVVAADKGTATFSDIANGIAQKYGFWLGDAFASGGSVGYDHKVMGITAKGGWEAVKRHFREIGKDIQSETFNVIGVGDMSGDVFGNGMLLSKQICLLAAFDHRDIFIDPAPNPAKTFKERQRLFNTPRTTWQDFNKKLISKGGGVFSRSAKSIKLTPEIQKMTGLSVDEVTPNELIHAVLKSNCELLWFGGIGSYVKSAGENNAEVRDKANDAIRINGADLKAKVVGEGANLGMTQAGRIEFARSGGRINTDAIDNSAGVDCSDNEVNIKILLSGAIESGELKEKGRVKLLESMTDDVSALVLAHNYDQTGAISLAEMNAVDDHHAYVRFMEGLEAEGRLDRDVEGLPSVAEMQILASTGGALSRPEISVLNAYAKIKLFDDLIDTDVADDLFYEDTLLNYFPKAVHGFEKALKSHRLRREIIISRLCNQIVDVGGPVFMARLEEQTNGTADDIGKAFSVAYEVLQIGEIRKAINSLDNKISAQAQLSLHEEISIVLQRVIGWLVRRGETESISARIARRVDGLKNVDETWIDVLSNYDSRRVSARIGRFVRLGIPEDLARDVALLRSSASGFDVVALTEKTGWPIRKSAKLFYDIGGRFKIDRLRSMSMKSTPKTHWEGLAQRRIDEDFYAAQASLALAAARLHIENGGTAKASTKTIIEAYIAKIGHNVGVYEGSFTKVSASGGWTLAKFAIINAQLRELID
ncbi:MAG: glutamate dehydrogenase [Robiginitomaculum sp.]|nr:MAG: glutamate dehydrogenase [Robiginitomaculum sp.]